MKPFEVEVDVSNVGVSDEPFIDRIEDEVAVPVSYPVRRVWTVTVEAVPGFMPVTVIKPLPLIATVPLPEFVPVQVKVGSQLPICSVKPDVVGVAVSNIGLRAAPLIAFVEAEVLTELPPLLVTVITTLMKLPISPLIGVYIDAVADAILV